MKNTMSVIKKAILSVLVAALALAALPLTNVQAVGNYDLINPPQTGEPSNERLEKIWAREMQFYERLGKVFDNIDAAFEKAQGLIDRASAKGKDVSAVQAALDAFKVSVKTTRPAYEGLNGIVNSHQGFDDTGKVTDAEKAKATVQEMGAKLKEIRSLMGETGKVLREAVRAFRDANKPTTAPDDRD
ncbi:MAG: hypothetical protein MUO77_07895 [Anaerolineales bacterium]|nr:hypothetical protein [Anaerolineales bacterium]